MGLVNAPSSSDDGCRHLGCYGHWSYLGGFIAKAKLSKNKIAKFIGNIYSIIFRGIPELLVIYLFYFGGSSMMTAIGALLHSEGFLGIPAFLAGAGAVGVISGAYQAEVFREPCCLSQKAKSKQRPPSHAQSATFAAYHYSTIDALCLAWLGNVWQLSIKDSALISVTGLAELMRQSKWGGGSTHRYFEFYIAGAILYLIITHISTYAFNKAENRVNRSFRGGIGRGLRYIFMDVSFLFETLGKLIVAVPTTLGLFFLSISGGAVLALGVTWMRVSPFFVLNRLARAYIFIFRGSPLLIQLFLIYYGLGQFIFIRHSAVWPCLRDPFSCAVIALALCTAGYTAEIFRGGLLAVPHTQIEAARSIGMSRFLLLRRIIAPLALRACLPAYSTEMVLMVKSTALASLVTVMGNNGRGTTAHLSDIPYYGSFPLRGGDLSGHQFHFGAASHSD